MTTTYAYFVDNLKATLAMPAINRLPSPPVTA